jgi:hypothetical protein
LQDKSKQTLIFTVMFVKWLHPTIMFFFVFSSCLSNGNFLANILTARLVLSGTSSAVLSFRKRLLSLQNSRRFHITLKYAQKYELFLGWEMNCA